jgi:hypothetical protein
MKKIAYLSILILSLALVSTSCCKEEDPIPDNPNVAYLGNWYNDETRVDGVVDVTVTQKEFEFQEVKLIVTASNNSSYNRVYDSWSISGTTLTAIYDGSPETYIIVSAPNAGKMTLNYSSGGKLYTYKLSQ